MIAMPQPTEGSRGRCKGGNPAGPRTIRISADRYSPAHRHKNRAVPCALPCSHDPGGSRLAVDRLTLPTLPPRLFLRIRPPAPPYPPPPPHHTPDPAPPQPPPP